MDSPCGQLTRTLALSAYCSLTVDDSALTTLRNLPTQCMNLYIHNHGRPRIVCMTARLDVTPKTTEQNRIARTGKSEAEVTNNKKLRSRYCTIEATKLTTDRHEASRGLFVLQQSYLYYLEYGSRPIVSVHVFVHLGLSLFHKKYAW